MQPLIKNQYVNVTLSLQDVAVMTINYSITFLTIINDADTVILVGITLCTVTNCLVSQNFAINS